MKYFIAGGGCYGSYYVRQLDRARERKKLNVSEIVVVDKNPDCAVAAKLSEVAGARLEVCDWLDFGKWLWERRATLADDMWVPTPLGPHIIYHWIRRQIEEESGVSPKALPYTGPLPRLPYAQTTSAGSLALSHAPGICPVNCVEPKICPLTKSDRDWEMRDTVKDWFSGLQTAVGVFVCQHHAHGVGTIPLNAIFKEWEMIRSAKAKRVAIATVSSCHGIVDLFELE